MPKYTLDRLQFDKAYLKDSSTIVRGFDGSRREVVRKIEFPIQMTFWVMDIKPTYNCLLRQPWILSIRTVPSSFHQKLKLIVGDKLVIIAREQDILVNCPKPSKYIKAIEEALETSFQSLKIISMTFVEVGDEKVKSNKEMVTTAKITLKNGYEWG
ncbi:hypothetical protein CR513_50058, partial [Mucuna pruriens]